MIDRWCRYVLDRQFSDPDGLAVAKHAVRRTADDAAAFEREETRGVHLRSDFPIADNERCAAAAAHFAGNRMNRRR